MSVRNQTRLIILLFMGLFALSLLMIYQQGRVPSDPLTIVIDGHGEVIDLY